MTEVSKKLSILTRPPLRGGTGIFFKKKYFPRIIENIYKSAQFLKLIPNIILVLNRIIVFSPNTALKNLKIHKNCIQQLNCLDMSQNSIAVKWRYPRVLIYYTISEVHITLRCQPEVSTFIYISNGIVHLSDRSVVEKIHL